MKKLESIKVVTNDTENLISCSEIAKKKSEEKELNLNIEINKIDPQLLIQPRLEYQEVRERLKEIYNIKKTMDKNKEKYKELEVFFAIIDDFNSQLQKIDTELNGLNEQISQIDFYFKWLSL